MVWCNTLLVCTAATSAESSPWGPFCMAFSSEPLPASAVHGVLHICALVQVSHIAGTVLRLQ